MAAVVLFFVIVTSGSGKGALVGRWEITDGYMSNGWSSISWLEFFIDGTYTLNTANYHGDYTFEGGRLKLEGILVYPMTYTIQIKGSQMIVYDGGERLQVEINCPQYLSCIEPQYQKERKRDVLTSEYIIQGIDMVLATERKTDRNGSIL